MILRRDVKFLKFDNFLIVSHLGLIIALIFLKIVCFGVAHHVEIKLRSIHQLRTLEPLLLKVVIG